MDNIHPIFDQILNKKDKELLLNQKACVIWLTGLSGSGKSTIAKGAESVLHQKGFLTQLLDGDNVRTGLCNNLTFSDEDRTENIRRVAEAAKLFLNCGVITLCSFISPTLEIRKMAREIIGEDFVEVYVNTPLEECEKRDVKGLYKKARKGEIPDFTGIHSDFEEPEKAELEIETVGQSIKQSVDQLIEYILPKINYQS